MTIRLVVFQERIQKSLKEVRLKAAQQRFILESTLEKSGHSIQPTRTEDENDSSSRDVDMSGPSAQTVTTERQQEKARGVVLAVQVTFPAYLHLLKIVPEIGCFPGSHQSRLSYCRLRERGSLLHERLG